MDVILNDNTYESPQPSKPLPTQGNSELNFLAALGFDASNPPLGNFLKQYHQLEGEWLVASPIHWQATHNDALITASGANLNLSEEESSAWFEEVKQFLAEESIDLHYHNANIWMLKVINKPSLNAKPVHLVQHQSLLPFLQEMDTTLYWQRVLTELQMFLSNHPHNEQRLGKLPINGLWIYGSGQFKLNDKKIIMTEDPQLLLAFPDKIKPLELKSAIDNKSILMINAPSPIEFGTLTRLVNDRQVNWFWNNKAYQTFKRHWWSKLWRG